MSCEAIGSCFTCTLAGLTSCPFRQVCGPNLPLAFGELPKVTYIHSRAFSVRVWPPTGDGVSLRSTKKQ